MPESRYTQVSLEVTPCFHCYSRCVRRSFFCGLDTDTALWWVSISGASVVIVNLQVFSAFSVVKNYWIVFYVAANLHNIHFQCGASVTLLFFIEYWFGFILCSLMGFWMHKNMHLRIAPRSIRATVAMF